MIPTPGEEVTANGLRYLVDAVDDVCVTYRTWQGTDWSEPRAIVRGAWMLLVEEEK